MMSEYSKRLEKIEEALKRVFPFQSREDWIAAVAGETGLPLRPASVDRITAPGWELLDRGGKRWRPLVMVLAHELCGGTYTSLEDLSSLVELPHNGSLIIDDIEDKALERRGGAAIHLIFGVDMAINTGNFMYFAPTYLLDQAPLDEAVKYRITKLYLRVMRCLHFGQGLDIQWHNDHGYLPSREEYLQMCRFKTGALARLAAEIGAASAGASEETVTCLGKVWEDIGVGFQILDDVKNLTDGNPGKMRGDDIVEGKKSLPVLCHADLSPDGGASLLDLFSRVALDRDQGRIAGDLIEKAIGLMETSGALTEAAAVADELLGRATQTLTGAFDPGPAREGMEKMIESFWEGLKK